MTYERREEILSKEAITIADVAELCSVSKSVASTIIRNIKLEYGDPLGVSGRVLVNDFMRFVRAEQFDRYGRRMTDRDNDFEVELKPEDKQRRVFSVMYPDGLGKQRLG